MPTPLFTDLAEVDVQRAFKYIAQYNTTAANRWLDNFYKRASVQAANPKSGRDRSDIDKGLRTFVVGRYVVFFRAEGQTIRILRVLHGSRDIDSIMSDDAE